MSGQIWLWLEGMELGLGAGVAGSIMVGAGEATGYCRVVASDI